MVGIFHGMLNNQMVYILPLHETQIRTNYAAALYRTAVLRDLNKLALLNTTLLLIVFALVYRFIFSC
jgi:hypothetical protein